jgi:hypothetical protein
MKLIEIIIHALPFKNGVASLAGVGHSRLYF